LTLPERERWDDLAREEAGDRILDGVVGDAGNEALVELVGRADVAAEPRGAGSRVALAQREQLAAQRPLAVQRAQRGTPRQAKLQAAHGGLQRTVGIAAVQRGTADLHVGGAGELPEIEQVDEVARPSPAPEQLVVARAARDLRGQLVGTEPAERAIQRDAAAPQAVLAEVGPEGEGILGL